MGPRDEHDLIVICYSVFETVSTGENSIFNNLRQLNMPKFEIADPHTVQGQQRRAYQDSNSRGSAILKPPCYDTKFVDLLHISRLS